MYARRSESGGQRCEREDQNKSKSVNEAKCEQESEGKGRVDE